MAQYEYDDTANQATGYSSFGGQQLANASSFEKGDSSAGYVGTLASLGIDDVEQLVAIAAIPEVRDELQSVLDMGSEDFQELLNRLQASLPPARATLVSAPAPKEFGLGVLPPTPEMIAAAERSAFAAIEAPVALPGSVNLIPYMAAIRNQGARGTCVSFTLTALNEYILRRRGIVQDLSEQHLYFEIKLIDGASGACGTWQVQAVSALKTRGQCREGIWPYNPNLPCNNHGALPAQARTNGLKYKLTTLQVDARNVAAYKTHMSKKRPVTISIPVYNSWYQSAETTRSGRITMRIGGEPQIGGHAVCLVGYQNNASSPGGGWFIVRNSWSTSWASQSPYAPGYGTIPFQYITNEAMEAFTAVVPGITAEGEEEDEGGEEPANAKSEVTITVGPNVKITITTA